VNFGASCPILDGILYSDGPGEATSVKASRCDFPIENLGMEFKISKPGLSYDVGSGV
jgi:hypothetical protein